MRDLSHITICDHLVGPSAGAKMKAEGLHPLAFLLRATGRHRIKWWRAPSRKPNGVIENSRLERQERRARKREERARLRRG